MANEKEGGSKFSIAPFGIEFRDFASRKELVRWLITEHTAWLQLTEKVRVYSPQANARAQKQVQVLNDLISAAEGSGTDDELRAQLSQQQLIPSDSLPGSTILGEPDKGIAQIMLLLQSIQMGEDVRLISTQTAIPVDKFAIAAAKLAPLSMPTEDRNRVAELFATTTARWNESLASLQSDHAEKIAQFVNQAETDLNYQEMTFRGQKQRVARLAGQLVLRGYRQLKYRERELENLKRAFIEHMRLAGPADYWEKKAQSHRKTRANLRWLVAGVVILAVLLTAGVYWWINTRVDTSHLGTIVLLSPAVLICLWASHLVFRAYNKNNDLLNDAEHRKVMAQTYLALTKEGAAVAAESERLLILQALVRPDTVGEDDVSSSSLIELLKVATNKGH